MVAPYSRASIVNVKLNQFLHANHTGEMRLGTSGDDRARGYELWMLESCGGQDSSVCNLRSCHETFLTAHRDGSVSLEHHASATEADKWTIEHPPSISGPVRIRSSQGTYLCSSGGAIRVVPAEDAGSSEMWEFRYLRGRY